MSRKRLDWSWRDPIIRDGAAAGDSPEDMRAQAKCSKVALHSRLHILRVYYQWRQARRGRLGRSIPGSPYSKTREAPTP